MANKRFKEKEIEKALREAKGAKGGAAKILGCHRNTVQNYINQSPELEAVVRDERESFLDRAEKILWEKIEEGDTRCLLFFLRTQGRRRGYNEAMNLRNEALLYSLLVPPFKRMISSFNLDVSSKERAVFEQIVRKCGLEDIFDECDEAKAQFLDVSVEGDLDESFEERKASKKRAS